MLRLVLTSYIDKMSSSNKIIKEYFKVLTDYHRLAENLKVALKSLLADKSINVLTIKHRVKSLDNFLEKIERKSYTKPFEQMEDICGIRVICYFPSEIEKIEELIDKEFKIVKVINKDNRNTPTQFGYRSQHYILKIKKQWTNTPHFRSLDGLKFELQLRTVLMDAWAEIEHKLAYKKFEHIPPQFRRKFSLLSAKLEEADEQFEELMSKIKDYKLDLSRDSGGRFKAQSDVSMNLDLLIALWGQKYPKSQRKVKDMRDLLDKLQESGVSLKEFSKIISEKGLKESKVVNEVLKDENN